jgi:diguanylate cyclase (GGDEF)-like protein
MSASHPALRYPPLSAVDGYLLAVTLAGCGLLAVTVGDTASTFLPTAPPEFWVFTALAVLGQMLTIKVRGYDEITSSTAFIYAILLLFGTTAAVLAQTASSLLTSLRDRRPVLQSSFALGQQTISLVVAGALLSALTDLPRPESSPPIAAFEVPGLFVAGGAYFVITTLLGYVGPALLEGESLRRVLQRDLTLQMLTAAVFISLAPIILLAAHIDLSLCLLLLLPMIAIYKGGREAVMNEHRATHDLLTGLPNRALFADRIGQAVKLARRENRSAAVLVLDLDHFKEINDTLGHNQGDKVLQTLGPRLEEVLRVADTVASLGGDEFGMLLPDATPAQACYVAGKVLEGLKQPLRAEGLTLQVGASIGIACFPAHGEDVRTLLQHADVAMFAAKENRNGYEVYAAGRDRESAARVLLASDLRSAVEDGTFALEHQPVLDIATQRVEGVEALARWIHPDRGAVSPAEFIPIAEQIGVIRPLTMRLLHQAIGEWHEWHAEGTKLVLAVNISARHLMSRDFVHEIDELLEEARIVPACLKLEITETTIMADPRRAEDVVRALSRLGVMIAIDDFGTGYSSLAYLNRLAVDQVKIDRSFVAGMCTSESSAVIVRSMIALAHSLGLEVVAEGVEDQDTMQALAEAGCDKAQGYFISRPRPADDFIAWLRRYSASSPGSSRAIRSAERSEPSRRR